MMARLFHATRRLLQRARKGVKHWRSQDTRAQRARRESGKSGAERRTGNRSVAYTTSPLLASKTPLWRSRFIVVLVACSFLVLLGRAVYVQVLNDGFYVNEGDKRFTHAVDVPANRGRITDRNGQLLATSVSAPSIWATPKDMTASPEQIKQLARALQTDVQDLERRLHENPRFVWLRRRADESQWKAVQALKLKGVHETREFKRRYPEGEAAAHVVGFMGGDKDEGLEGVEFAFERELQGQGGNRAVMKDRLGQVIEDIGEQVQPVHGRDVQLSIDAKVQYFAYQRLKDAVQAHKAKSGSAVVLDARTGEVLALANFPSYDPSNKKPADPTPIRNRAITDTFEPGSTVKPFIAALALQSGHVRADTVLDTAPGSLVVTGIPIKDAHPRPTMTVADVVQRSSNIGTVRMAMQFERQAMWDLYSQLGYGQKPNLEFPGVVTGRLRPAKTWRPIEQATMSYGYGLSASLFQIARSYMVFARDGEMAPVTMLKQRGPVAGTRVIDPQAAQSVRKMLHAATAPGGTAQNAQASGYTTGGKTGTAHKQEGDGYNREKYRAWFVGLAPIQHPRVIVAVMVDEPSNGKFYGGDVAAPVFSHIVQETLRILEVPPDLSVKPMYVTQVDKESF